MKNKTLIIPMLGLALLGGAAAGLYGSAHAQTATTATGSASTTNDKPHGPHRNASGQEEVVLTGDAATKVTQAALAKVPGGTVERVETDVDGDSYEAHMIAADGSRLTVKFDANFNVTKTETGPNRPARTLDTTTTQ